MIYARISTPLGGAFATLHDEALAGLYFDGARHSPCIESEWQRDDSHPLALACARQLDEYFAGLRRSFDLPLAPRGTPFQQRVWAQIARVPFGATITYAQLAARAGAGEAVRAAGAATGRNPLTIVVPCHRIVGSDGALTGYAGGLERKRRLLELEGALQPALA
jgi:methylated-DNA-[protein]-cysteine S-methyltransferase